MTQMRNALRPELQGDLPMPDSGDRHAAEKIRIVETGLPLVAQKKAIARSSRGRGGEADLLAGRICARRKITRCDRLLRWREAPTRDAATLHRRAAESSKPHVILVIAEKPTRIPAAGRCSTRAVAAATVQFFARAGSTACWGRLHFSFVLGYSHATLF